MSKYLAENYDVQVVGITVSKEGAKYASDRCSKLPVDIRLMDYRDLNEEFDRIVSVGMCQNTECCDKTLEYSVSNVWIKYLRNIEVFLM